MQAKTRDFYALLHVESLWQKKLTTNDSDLVIIIIMNIKNESLGYLQRNIFNRRCAPASSPTRGVKRTRTGPHLLLAVYYCFLWLSTSCFYCPLLLTSFFHLNTSSPTLPRFFKYKHQRTKQKHTATIPRVNHVRQQHTTTNKGQGASRLHHRHHRFHHLHAPSGFYCFHCPRHCHYQMAQRVHEMHV